jgi:hypothetical protein
VVTRISEHLVSIGGLIHKVHPQGVEKQALLAWAVEVSMGVLGIGRAEALEFVRRTTK